jgi:uroporphyrinogen-III synthase
MKPFKILSTKILSPQLIKEVPDHIIITEKEMIQIEPIQNIEKVKEIEYSLNRKLPLIFTSANAAEILIQFLKQQHIDLTDCSIYCLSGKTHNLLLQYFPNHSIISANNAFQLAKKIIADNVKEIIFYCGNIRRDELPDALHKKNIRIHEVVVYQTIEAPSKIDEAYDGILFFSPSGVRSFFSINQLPESTICFTIGETTANSISEYTKNKVIQSKSPDPANMISEVASFFKTLSEHGIKE